MDPNQLNLQGIVIALGVVAFMGVLLVFIVMMVVLAARHTRRMNERWAEWARSRGVALTGSHPMLQVTGTLHGIGVQMVTHRYVHRSNRSRRVSYKHEVIATPQMNIGDLTLSRDGFFASIGKVFGGQDIQTADPAFDAAFVVRSANEHAARAVLTPTVRAALLEAQRVLGDVHVETNGVRALRAGTANPETIDQALDVIARTALTFGR